MRHPLFKAVLSIFCLFSVFSFANEGNDFDMQAQSDFLGRKLLQKKGEQVKLYLSPEMFHMDSDKMYIYFDEAFVPIPAIFSDDKGIYITTQKWGFWYCQNGHPNPPWRLVCAVCGKT